MVQLVEESNFGMALNPFTKQQEPIRRFTFTNKNGLSAAVINYGATITSLCVPDVNGKVDDITLGFDNIAGYLAPTNPYMGCVVGRMCSRVGNGKFMLDGREVKVSVNFFDKHQLHGGKIGFDKVIWEVVEILPDGVVMCFVSPDGHEGYPGEVTATVTYRLTENNCFSFCLEAKTTKATPVNMTNHAYFNLAGHNAGKKGMCEHTVIIRADKYTDMDEETVPNGKICDLDKDVLDLRQMTNVGKGLQKILPAKGYDHNYVLDWKPDSMTFQAKACHPDSGRWMEISSNQPCMHFYTAHNMPDIAAGDEPTIIGKGDTKYEKHGSFCMETHWYPDAVNHENFPSVILRPGKKYCHTCVFKFGAREKDGNNDEAKTKCD